MWSPARLRLKKSVHLSAKEIHTQTRNSVWESRLPYVLQRFVGTNLLWEGELFENLRTKHPENTSSDESLYAELVRLIHAATFPVTFFASASTAAKWQLAWHTIKCMIKERCQFWAKKRFLKVGSYLRKISKAEIWTHVLRARLNVRTFGVWNLTPTRWILFSQRQATRDILFSWTTRCNFQVMKTVTWN